MSTETLEITNQIQADDPKCQICQEFLDEDRDEIGICLDCQDSRDREDRLNSEDYWDEEKERRAEYLQATRVVE